MKRKIYLAAGMLILLVMFSINVLAQAPTILIVENPPHNLIYATCGNATDGICPEDFEFFNYSSRQWQTFSCGSYTDPNCVGGACNLTSTTLTTTCSPNCDVGDNINVQANFAGTCTSVRTLKAKVSNLTGENSFNITIPCDLSQGQLTCSGNFDLPICYDNQIFVIKNSSAYNANNALVDYNDTIPYISGQFQFTSQCSQLISIDEKPDFIGMIQGQSVPLTVNAIFMKAGNIFYKDITLSQHTDYWSNDTAKITVTKSSTEVKANAILPGIAYVKAEYPFNFAGSKIDISYFIVGTDVGCIINSASIDLTNCGEDCGMNEKINMSLNTGGNCASFLDQGGNVTMRADNGGSCSVNMTGSFSQACTICNATWTITEANVDWANCSGKTVTVKRAELWNNTAVIGAKEGNFGSFTFTGPPCQIAGANIKTYCGSDGCSAGERIALNITVENMSKCDSLSMNKMEIFATTATGMEDGCGVTMINNTQIFKDAISKTYYANWTVSVPSGCEGRTVYAKTARLYNSSRIIAAKTVAIPPGYGNFTFAGGVPTQLDYILLIPASASLTVPYTLDYSVWACYTTGGCNLVTSFAKYNSSNVSRANFVTPEQPNRINAISEGSITVTANYTEGGVTKYATAALEVLPPGQVVLSHIIIEPFYNSTAVGNNQSYIVTAYKSNGTNYDVTLHANTTYNSSNLSVAQMFVTPKNIANATGPGRANITANYTEGAKKVSAYSILNVTGVGPGELKTQIVTPQPICVDSGPLKSSEFCYKPDTPAWCPINLSYYAFNKDIYFNQSTQGQVDNWTWFFNIFEPNLNRTGTNIALANITYKYLALGGQKMDWKTPMFIVNKSGNSALDDKVIPVVNLNDLPNNFPPLIKILSPQSGQAFQGCGPYIFNASVCDDTTPATQLKVNFSIMKGIQNVFKQAICYSDGNCNTSYTFTSNGNYRISAFVFDNANNMGWDGYKYVTVTGCGTGPVSCYDGTPVNQCSQANPGMWCNASAILEPGCATHNCNCPSYQFCNTSSNTCVNQGNTFTCTKPPASLNEINCTNFGCCWDACIACRDVLPQDSRACSKYNGSYACERDVCGFGQTGAGTSGCGTPLKENCRCEWTGTSCGLVWDGPGGSYQCTQTTFQTKTCAEYTTWELNHTFTSTPPGYGTECCQKFGGGSCTDNWYITSGPCGVVFRPLPFFEWWNVLAVVGLLIVIYAFVLRKRNI